MLVDSYFVLDGHWLRWFKNKKAYTDNCAPQNKLHLNDVIAVRTHTWHTATRYYLLRAAPYQAVVSSFGIIAGVRFIIPWRNPNFLMSKLLDAPTSCSRRLHSLLISGREGALAAVLCALRCRVRNVRL